LESDDDDDDDDDDVYFFWVNRITMISGISDPAQ